jgi:hypothetical protein
MFKNLSDFSYQRSTKEAIGFYISYLVILILIASVLGGILSILSGTQGFNAGYALGFRVGQFVAIAGVLALSFMLLKSKNALKDIRFILILLVSGVLAIFGGALLGLIPVAYLTTQKSK